MKKKWKKFPHEQKEFAYEGGALKKHWDRLHRGDCEPFPSVPWVDRVFREAPAARKAAGKLGTDGTAAADALQEAWRAFHRGDFQLAAERGLALGPVGYGVADKAIGIYATYLEPDLDAQLELFDEAAERSQTACKAFPDHANSHYLVAYSLGRHSQASSVVKALAAGTAGRIKKALERTLELEPRHAEAHIAAGTFHAEIVDKAGSLVAGLAYGASENEALAHYRKALALHPGSAIARVEYAAGLLMLDSSNGAQARKLLAQAAKLAPADATERLDVELARSRLKAL